MNITSSRKAVLSGPCINAPCIFPSLQQQISDTPWFVTEINRKETILHDENARRVFQPANALVCNISYSIHEQLFPFTLWQLLGNWGPQPSHSLTREHDIATVHMARPGKDQTSTCGFSHVICTQLESWNILSATIVSWGCLNIRMLWLSAAWGDVGPFISLL